ncbi:MAG: cobalamin B12-binding domain-containing protein [Bacteroidetes bacterium]|nr:cobalamin B12-binding domain-containing protein [Bacteroidota bacterium]
MGRHRIHQSEIHIKEPNGLSAVVACYQGEVHDIAITCVASYLISQGWRMYHLGQDILTDDLALFIEAKKPNLVAISADIVEDERRFVYDINNKIVPATKKAGAISVVGGQATLGFFGPVEVRSPFQQYFRHQTAVRKSV